MANCLLLLPLKSKSGAELPVLVLLHVSEHQGEKTAGIWRANFYASAIAIATSAAIVALLIPSSTLLSLLLLMLVQVVKFICL